MIHKMGPTLMAVSMAALLGFGCSNGGTNGTDDTVSTDDAGIPRAPVGGPEAGGGNLSPITDLGGGVLDTASPPAGGKYCFSFCDTVADCPQGTVACQNQRCMMCTSDADCAQYGGAKKCDVSQGMCVMCQQDAHCYYAGQKMWSGKCDTTLNLCVKCTSSTDCGWQDSNTKLCVGGRCVQCASDAECSGAQMKGCDSTSGFCSKCKNDAECCPPNQTCGLKCDPGSGYCTCQTAQHCSDVFSQGKWTCKSP